MLTCKVGQNIVDTFSYKDEKLREWSNKGMLKCSVCNENMIYCHGDFKIPYFRHEKNSNCPDIYSEGITEEHLNGIKILYKWLQTQEGIINLQLEKWIPETRQRPDIYFERKEDGEIKRYAIEYQCSPIATKYNERHDLYRLNNINDIWILGTEKYYIDKYIPLKKYDIYNQIIEDIRTKTIEREVKNNNCLLYLTQSNRLIKISEDFIKIYSHYNEKKTIFNFKIDTKLIDKCTIKDIINKECLYGCDNTDLKNKINILHKYTDLLNNIIANYTIKNCKYSYSIVVNMSYIILKITEQSGRVIYSANIDVFSEDILCSCCDKEINNYKNQYDKYYKLADCCNNLNNQFSIVNKNCNFSLISKFENKYYAIEFTNKDFNRIFYINKSKTNCTVRDSYTKPFRGKRGGIGWNRIYYNRTIDSFEYEEINIKKIIEYISNTISNTLRNKKYGSDEDED